MNYSNKFQNQLYKNGKEKNTFKQANIPKWEREGVKLKYFKGETGPESHSVRAYDRSGVEIAHFRFAPPDKNPESFSAFSAHVDPEHRRKGIATAAYDLVEQKSKKTIVPGVVSEEARAFWEARRKSFEQSSWSFVRIDPACYV